MIEIKTKLGQFVLSEIMNNRIKSLPDLVRKAVKLTAEEQTENLNIPRSFDGSGLRALSPRYRQWKARHLGYTDIFKGKELKLINSVRERILTSLHGQVYIDKQRDTIMSYLENSGRKGWGIGARLENKLKKLQEDWLQKNI